MRLPRDTQAGRPTNLAEIEHQGFSRSLPGSLVSRTAHPGQYHRITHFRTGAMSDTQPTAREFLENN